MSLTSQDEICQSGADALVQLDDHSSTSREQLLPGGVETQIHSLKSGLVTGL